MSQSKTHKQIPVNTGLVLQLARRRGVSPVISQGGKKYRLVPVNPSELDADNLPEHLKKRLKNLNK